MQTQHRKYRVVVDRFRNHETAHYCGQIKHSCEYRKPSHLALLGPAQQEASISSGSSGQLPVKPANAQPSNRPEDLNFEHQKDSKSGTSSKMLNHLNLSLDHPMIHGQDARSMAHGRNSRVFPRAFVAPDISASLIPLCLEAASNAEHSVVQLAYGRMVLDMGFVGPPYGLISFCFELSCIVLCAGCLLQRL